MNCPYCQTFFEKIPHHHRSLCQESFLHHHKTKELYRAGMSIEKLNKLLRVDRSAISKFLKREGVDVKPSRNMIDINFFKKETPQMFWLLGIIAADGHINGKHQWSISQSGEDGFKLIKYIKTLIGHTNDIYQYIPKKGKQVHTITIRSKDMVEDLSRWNINAEKTKSFTLPNFNTDDDFKNFLRGYLDGDGSIGVYNNGKDIHYLNISLVGNSNFINQCIERVPFKPKTSLISAVSHPMLSANWSGQKGVQFGNWLFSDSEVYKNYKQNIFQDYINNTALDEVWSENNRKYTLVRPLIEGASASKMQEIGELFGVSFQTLYVWKKKNRKVERIGRLYCSMDS